MTFAVGDTSQSFSVPIINTDEYGPSITVLLALSSPSGATLGSQSAAVLTIVRDWTPPSLLPPGLNLWQLSFSGPNHTVYESFTTQGPFLAPHWLYAEIGPPTAGSSDRAFPVCYTRNTAMVVSGIWLAGSDTFLPPSTLISGIGPVDPNGNAINIPATPVSIDSNSGYIYVNLPATAASQPFQDAIVDAKLQKRLTVVEKHPKLKDMLDRLATCTGLSFSVADNLAHHDPDLGHLDLKNTTAYAIMEIIAERDLDNGRWEKIEGGYRLEGVSRVLPLPSKFPWYWIAIGLSAAAVSGAYRRLRADHGVFISVSTFCRMRMKA